MVHKMKDILHLKAPGNWMNDPNGFIYYEGKYHLFYQYFPYAPEWGTMHWGHAVSEDLIHWEHLGVALFPTKRYDQNGVFSGSALEKDGKLYLYYSAVRYLETDPEDIHRAVRDRYESSQAMLISGDGMHFDNWKDKKQILPVIRDENVADSVHTRDPKVWNEDGIYYMILGSTYREKAGRVLFYVSEDGENWKYAAQYRHEKFGRIVECPDLFRLEDTWVFLASPMYVEDAGKGYEHHAVCTLAKFDGQDCQLTLREGFQYVDYGMDLYAPQTNVDREGRRVMVGWMRMPKAVEKEEKTWIGMMCLPRVIDVKEGHIYFRVHPEVERYFSGEIQDRKHLCTDRPCRIKAVLEEGECLVVEGYRIWVEQGYLKTDRSKVFQGMEGYAQTAATPRSLDTHRLDIFVEPNLIEIFINEGEYVISHVVYGLDDAIEGEIDSINIGGL